MVLYINLQLYLSLGMTLTKINRVLEFKQSEWMKKYFDFKKYLKYFDWFCGFSKYFLKLMTNSVYGKTMENLGKRINVRLVDKAEDFSKYNSKPTYITHIFFL